MAIIGGQINPAYYPQPDYSGVVRSAQMQSQGIANIGQQIGGAIKQYGDDEKTIKKSAQMAKSIRDAIPELADMANNSLEQLSNPDLSQRDRLAIAEGIQDSLKIGVMGLENNRSNAMLQLEAAKIAAAANKEPQGTFMTTQEFSSLMNSGVPVKGVPMPDGRVFVTDISGNQPGILGSGVAMVNGQPTKIPTTPVNLPSWGAGGNYSNPNDGVDANTMTNEEILAMAAATEMPGSGRIPNYNFARDTQIPANVNTVASPPRPGAVQQIPYVQRVINDVNNGFAYGNTGANVTPPTGQAAASVNNGFSMIPNAPVPTGDIYNLQGGDVGVTRLPGSSAELDYQTKAAGLEKTKLEAEKIKAEAEKTSNQSNKAKNNFSTVIEEATNAYSNLYNKGGAVVGGQFSLGQVLASTNAGQKFGEITGSEAQLFRNYLESLAPKILLGIMASTGLSATQLNSNAELQLQLKSLGDPSKPIQSNLAALDTLDKMYGDGTSVSKMLSKNPKLGALMKESGFDYSKKEAGDTELDSIIEEVKQIREKMGVQ
jgi:hypothetical protein